MGSIACAVKGLRPPVLGPTMVLFITDLNSARAIRARCTVVVLQGRTTVPVIHGRAPLRCMTPCPPSASTLHLPVKPASDITCLSTPFMQLESVEPPEAHGSSNLVWADFL